MERFSGSLKSGCVVMFIFNGFSGSLFDEWVMWSEIMRKPCIFLFCTLMMAACQPADSVKTPALKTLGSEAASQVKSMLPENMAVYQEKFDLAQLGLALGNTHIRQGEEKEREWNQRLIHAKNSHEVKAVLQEQLTMYQEVENALRSIKMQSEKGKAIHAQLLEGVAGSRALLQDLQAVDWHSSKGIELTQEATVKIKLYTHRIAQGMQDCVQWMKEHGIDINRLQEQKFQQSLQKLKETLKN